jgi:uncharacterized RDD family membrane protein YckC
VTRPPSSVPRDARPFQGNRAGLATRMLAGAIDGVVLLALLAGGYVAWVTVVVLWNPAGFRLPIPSRPLVLIVGHLVGTAYLTLCWRVSGRTYGDEVIGLRVLGRRGGPPGLVTALARAVVCLLFPFGLLWTAVSRESRSLPDLLLRTSVVYDWRTPSPARASGSGGAVDEKTHVGD